ncbi:RIO1 family regulatory kinase/ATPase [Archangium violaceum]|uniref:RIO1 family regulatory kinase/ATPase domain-containing protein n=1 Tax=Archangium violaceum TaxID=83451 RepID=UPI002B2E243B|nr:RIO1 family regulatory kinase/ATPase [Archangium gephyra]
MNEALQVLLADGVIDEVVGRLKSGKEADVYLVRHKGEVVAAKIYKEREHRNFRNNSGYREGRQVRNSRTARAIAKGSRFGVRAAEDAWKTAEADALGKLHVAGVCVPRPVMFYEGVLLMELVLDLEGHPAPRLEEAALTAEEASALYFDLRNQAIRMLCCDLIHGDLSAFNILLGNRGATIIDFPQVVDAAANSQAEFFFKRDVENLRSYFESTDPSLRARAGDAQEIWRTYLKRELTPDFVPTGRFQGDGPRRSSGGPRNGDNRFNNGPPRGDRPQGDRPPRQERPQGEGPREMRPQGDRPPRQDRSQGEGPREMRPQGERPPRNDRPMGDRPPRNDRPPRGDRPQGDRPPRGDRPQGDRPPRGDRPQGERPPRNDRPQGERIPRGDRARGDRFPRGNGEGQRQWGEQGARPSEQQPGQQGPRGRPPERRSDRPDRGPRQPRGGGGGPAVTYVQKAPLAPSASPSKPEDES